MANKYYDTASVGALSPFETPETAGTTLASVLATIASADETIWVKNTSSEATVGNITYTAPAVDTYAKPLRLFSVSDFDASPGTLASGAFIGITNAAQTLTFDGSWYFKGLTIGCNAVGAAISAVVFGAITNRSGHIILEDCQLVNKSTSTSTLLATIGTTASATPKYYVVDMKNCSLSFGNTAQKLRFRHVITKISNLTLTGSVAPITLFLVNEDVIARINITNSDLTGLAWTNLASLTTGDAQMVFENCKIPVGATIHTGTLGERNSITLINVDSGATHYKYEKHTHAGVVSTNATIYANTNPLTDDGVAVSNKLVSNANASYCNPLCRTYLIPVSDTVTAITPYVEFLVDGDAAAALNTDDVFIEVDYLSDAGSPKGTKITSHPGVITAGAAISAGTVTYTGDGYTTERTHRVSTTSITPAQKGFVKITVNLAKPSTTIYVGVVGVA